MDVSVDYRHSIDGLTDIPVADLARYVLTAEGRPETSEVSISFVDDDEMTRLNESYRGRNGVTDVLSFECDGVDDEFSVDVDVYEVGDIVIAPDVALRQCGEYGNDLTAEIELLCTHGLLHLCGYDHLDDDEAEVMEARERELLSAWRKNR